VTADFGSFREVKHLLIIFSLYRFEFYTKTLIFTVFEMSNFVLTKQHLREVLIFFNWKKSAAEAQSKFMVTLLQRNDKSCREWFRRFKDGDFSVEDKPCSGQPKKFEDKELEARITRRRSESNTRGACRIIGDNSISRFCTIESHGNDSKTRKLGAL